MKLLHYFLLFVAGSMLLLACSKEMSREGIGPSPGNCDYAPYTTGSTFSYIDVNQTRDTLSYTFTVSGDTTINNVSYKKVGDDSVFTCSNCKDGVYTQIASILTFQGFKADDLKITYLKDNAAAGSTWSDTIVVNNGLISSSGILQHTITAQGITKTVNGKDYLNVIAVRMDAFAIVQNNPVPVGTISTSYYAKGIGLIEADHAQDTMKLIAYKLLP